MGEVLRGEIRLVQQSTTSNREIIDQAVKFGEEMRNISVRHAREMQEQSSRDGATAVAAALAAQEKAGTKSENATSEQIRQIVTLMREMTTNTNEKLTALATVASTGEGRSKGMNDAWGWIFAAIVGALSVITTAAAVVEAVMLSRR